MRRFLVIFGILNFLIFFSCSSKEYIAPNPKDCGLLTIKNSIFLGGFYIKVDNKEADFLYEEINIPLKPGKHKIEVFNRETTCKKDVETIQHKFKFKFKITKGENKVIILSFRDKSYSKKTWNESERREFRGMEASKKK